MAENYYIYLFTLFMNFTQTSTVKPLWTFDITTKFDTTTIWMERFLSSRWGRWLEIFKNIVFNTPRNTCCGYLLELPPWGDSNKYPPNMFLGVIKGKKSFLSFIVLVHVGILYSDKFFLTADSWKTNAVVVTKVLCTTTMVIRYHSLEVCLVMAQQQISTKASFSNLATTKFYAQLTKGKNKYL